MTLSIRPPVPAPPLRRSMRRALAVLLCCLAFAPPPALPADAQQTPPAAAPPVDAPPAATPPAAPVPPVDAVAQARTAAVEATKEVAGRIERARKAIADTARRVGDARDRGRALLAGAMDQPTRAGQAAEAFGVLAGAADAAARQVEVARLVGERGNVALGALPDAAEVDIHARRDEALAAAGDAERASAAAISAEALALKAEAELATRAAGVASAGYPDPWLTRLAPFWIITAVFLGVLIVVYLVRLWQRSRGRDRAALVPEGDDARLFRSIGNVNWWFMAALLVGVGVQVFWLAAGGGGLRDASTEVAFVLHLGTSGAAMVVGGLLGFLFGLPRTPDATTITPDLESDSAWRTRVATNTSLERVSTWLTTLILGATLVQFGDVTSGLWGIAGTLSGAPDGAATPGRVFTLSLVVFYFGVGFLGFYLLTRLYLTHALAMAVGQGRFTAAETLEEMNTRLDAALAEPEPDPVALRALLDRAGRLDGASQRPDHLVLRLRALARLHARADLLKADGASIRREAVRDLERLEGAATGWGKPEAVKETLGPFAAALKVFGGEKLFQKHGIGSAAVTLQEARQALEAALAARTVEKLQEALEKRDAVPQIPPSNGRALAELDVRATALLAQVSGLQSNSPAFATLLGRAKIAFGLVDAVKQDALRKHPDVVPFVNDLP